MNTILLTLASGFVFLTAFLTYLLIQVPKNYWLKWLAVPLLLLLSFAYVTQFPKVLGLPKEGYPEQEFVLVGYKATLNKSEHLVIQAWVTEKGQSRLYEFPFTQQVADELTRLAKLQGKGGYKGKFGKGTDPSNPEDGMGLNEIKIPQGPMPQKDKHQ